MAIYMPPLARKKKVPEKYQPDSFRVISMDAEEYHPKYPDCEVKPVYEKDTLPTRKLLPDIPVRQTRSLTKSISDFRAHNPQPKSCSFICHDVRLLNEPICTVATWDTQQDQANWWPSGMPREPLPQPPHTLDSTYRKDFLYRESSVPSGSTRHLSNPNKVPALGTVPVNHLSQKDGKQRFFKEDISYQHIYNSRANPNYPYGLRRQGAFVWKQLSQEQREKFIDYQKQMEEYERNMANQKTEYTCEDMNKPKIVPEPEVKLCPSSSENVNKYAVKSSSSTTSLTKEKKMTPAATPLASPSLSNVAANSPLESIFYEQDVGTQTSPVNRCDSPALNWPNVNYNLRMDGSKLIYEIPKRTE